MNPSIPQFWLDALVGALLTVFRILLAAALIDSVIDWR